MINTPVLVIGYKRKDSLKQIIDTLRESEVRNIYFSFEGWKNEEEKKLCLEVRELVNTIDWKTDTLKVFYEDENKGIFDHIVNSINWFFSNVEMGMILEDDIIPKNEYYRFCEEMLLKYKDNKLIKSINTFSYIDTEDINSYYFSILQSSWGWATWKDRWNSVDITLSNIKENDIFNILYVIYQLPLKVISYYLYLFNRSKEDYKSLEGWDYNFLFNIFKQNGICIQSNTSLVLNNGADEFGEHFSKDSIIESNDKGNIYPLKEPEEIKLNINYDVKRILKEYVFLK